MKLSLFVAAASTLLVSSPAYAQFSGPRVEGRLASESVEATIRTGDPLDTGDEQAIAYGGEVGYDFNLGPAVVGAYVGLEGSNLRSCEEVFGNDEGCIDQGRNLYAGARVGFTVLPRVMVYAKGGLSNGSIDIAYDGNAGGSPDFEASESFGGYHLGVGAEVALVSGLYGRVEYVHTDYGEFRFDPTTFGDITRGQAMVGLGLRF